MTMIHLAAEKACYVGRSVDETPTPCFKGSFRDGEWDWITSTPWVFYRQSRNVLARLIPNSHDFFFII